MAVRRVNNSKTFQVFTHLPSNMGRRAEEVRAVGAYVEPATSDVSEFYSAVVGFSYDACLFEIEP